MATGSRGVFRLSLSHRSASCDPVRRKLNLIDERREMNRVREAFTNEQITAARAFCQWELGDPDVANSVIELLVSEYPMDDVRDLIGEDDFDDVWKFVT